MDKEYCCKTCCFRNRYANLCFPCTAKIFDEVINKRNERERMMNSSFDRDVTFEIVEHIGVLTKYTTGWQKELNLVAWNGGAPKYDIRDWSPDKEHMSRGVTLSEKEMKHALGLLNEREKGIKAIPKKAPAKSEKDIEWER